MAGTGQDICELIGLFGPGEAEVMEEDRQFREALSHSPDGQLLMGEAGEAREKTEFGRGPEERQTLVRAEPGAVILRPQVVGETHQGEPRRSRAEASGGPGLVVVGRP